MEYTTLNKGQGPLWGLDRSVVKFKQHILCCTNTHSRQPTEQENTDNKEESLSPTPKFEEEVATVTGTAIKGAWFHITDGWNAGSHDDAIHFCASKKILDAPLEVCPYEACEYSFQEFNNKVTSLTLLPFSQTVHLDPVFPARKALGRCLWTRNLNNGPLPLTVVGLELACMLKTKQVSV